MTTMRIDDQTHQMIRKYAKGRPMHEVVHEAMDDFARKQFFAELNSTYESQNGDSDAWDQEQTEWEATLSDGLEDDGA